MNSRLENSPPANEAHHFGYTVNADRIFAGGLFSNRLLTLIENICLGQNMGEFHSGFRAYRRAVLEKLPIEQFSDDFVFDSQFLVSAVDAGFRIGEIPVPVRYMPEASSINFRRSVRYGLGTLWAVAQFVAKRAGFPRAKIFAADAGR